jgi:hypothetical protein
LTISLPASKPVDLTGSDTPPIVDSQAPLTDSRPVPAGSWSPLRERTGSRAIASTPSYPLAATKQTRLFVRQVRAELQSAAQQYHRFAIPHTPGLRSTLLQDLMGAGAPSLLPPDTAAPDSAIAETDNPTRTAIKYYFRTQANAFEGLTPEGDEFARGAIVALLDNVKQPPGAPGRLDERQIPAALRLIEDIARELGQPETATTGAITTPMPAPPTRRQSDALEDKSRADTLVRRMSSDPGNKPGLLTAEAWMEITAIEDPALRQNVAERAFHDYRRVLDGAYASASWSAVDPEVLATMQSVSLAVPFARQTPDMTSLQGWARASFQHETMTKVRSYQEQIDVLVARGDDPAARSERVQLGRVVANEMSLVFSGRGVPDPTGPDSAALIKAAYVQYERLLDQLISGDGGAPQRSR